MIIMKKKAIIAGLAALTLTASLSGLIVSAENEATVPEDNSAYEVQLPEVAESSEDTAASYNANSWGDFTYELDSTSTYATITAYNGTSGDVVVPDMVNGVPVKKLADKLFKGNTKITSVRINCTQLAVIPYQCFSGCTNLQSVNIPEGVITITGQAFENCSSLTSITFPSTLEAIKSHVSVYY